MNETLKLNEKELKHIINESIRRILKENTDQFVDVNNFIYNGKKLTDVGMGESFCYCPCDIDGTPKMYYGDSHYYCAGCSVEDILKSFGCSPNDFDYETLDGIVSEIWLNSWGRGRVFYDKYIVVGEDGHIPNKEYIDGIISFLGGTYDDYSVVFNIPTIGVAEITCQEAFKYGKNDKPNTIDVPEEICELYISKNSYRDAVNRRFPTNMTRAQYYSLIRQENKIRKKDII